MPAVAARLDCLFVLRMSMERLEEQLTLVEEPPGATFRRAFDAAIRQLVTHVNRPMFQVFVSKVKPLECANNVATLGVRNELDRSWLSSRYGRMIGNAIATQLGHPVTVEFVPLPPETDDHLPPEMTLSDSEPQTRMSKPLAPLPLPHFMPGLTFDTFVVTPSNRHAEASAQAVVTGPGTRFNPLFIFGGVGLGKTHLLHAIGVETLQRRPDTRVACMTGEAFADQYITALRGGCIDEFRRMQRSVDLWLIDDIQFIAGKERTQEEFFHTFNALYQTGKQMVLVSDKPPKGICDIQERLRSRFEHGMMAEIQYPKADERAAILLDKAKAERFDLPMDVVHFIADKIQSSIRTLEGALTRLISQVSLTAEPPSIAMASAILGGFFIDSQPQRQAVSVDAIQKACCKYYRIELDELVGTRRTSSVAEARKVAMYLARENTPLAWKAIGRHFGGRDHSTVLHAHRSVAQSVGQSSELDNALREVMRLANGR